MDLERLRRIFPVIKKMVYLDHAANGPCSTLVSKAVQQFLSECSNEELTTPVDPNQRAGIVSLKVRNLSAVMNRLRRNRIAVSSRGGGVRVSPHFYNTIKELDSLVSVLRTN